MDEIDPPPFSELRATVLTKVKTLALEKKALPLRGNIEVTLHTKLTRFD